MKVNEFIDKLYLALNSKTKYVSGCFGAPMNDANKARYSNNNEYNRNQASVVKGLDADTFGFDCVCLIKGILWGWNKDTTKRYGGASYGTNGVPDVGANTLCNRYLQNVSTDFKNIEVGEVVWMYGHVGVYVGEGKVIECTSNWEGKVLMSSLANLGYTEGHKRTWTKHGKLPWVDYANVVKVETPKVDTSEVGKRKYKVQAGDTLSKIASRYNTTVDKLLEDNVPTHHRMTRNYVQAGWTLIV